MIYLCFGFTVDTLLPSKPTSRPLDSSDMMVSLWSLAGPPSKRVTTTVQSRIPIQSCSLGFRCFFHLIAVQSLKVWMWILPKLLNEKWVTLMAITCRFMLLHDKKDYLARKIGFNGMPLKQIIAQLWDNTAGL